ncbi:lysylphosphatidylglycerol synthase transmembrane domain-containing protein [Kribbella sp. DT2]|uniref:lysylphosphatidylglycerol synthase transmembrane domain-containing protein n=1 Tax=Kribbella sp. DT2 TaxID=3393427 RepID=UPI003CF73BA8
MKTAGRSRRVVASVLTGVAIVALLALLPRAVGTSWSTVGTILGRVSFPGLIALTVVWIAGLWAHSFVLAASLPGLTKRRGLTLSLTGSAVANVLPFGGAAGTGLNFAMARRWGFTSGAFAGFIAVTTLLNVLAKLGVVALALALVPLAHTASALPLGQTTLLTVPVLAALGAVVWFLASPGAAERSGRALERLARLVRLKAKPTESIPRLRESILRIVRGGWRPMTLGMAAYLVLQLGLLWLCYSVLGTSLSLPVLITGLAVERLLTLIPVTPGGAGVVEVGTTAALVALGGDPAAIAAGMLLYRGFTYLLEIPVGGVTLALWMVHDRRRAVAA